MQHSSTEQTPSKGWHGSLDLVFAKADGKTQLTHNQVRSPLKVQRPFYPEGSDICHSVVLHTAGGVVGGDRMTLNFHLKPLAKALITTAAATKIYRSNGLQARQSIQMQVDADACLEWLPQETIVFNGAIYRQDLRVELAPEAIWLGWEITRFGRSARGERFCLGEWRSHTEVWQQGRPLWIDRQWLPGKEEIINSPHGLAGQPVVATLAWIGQPVSAEIVEKARNLWQQGRWGKWADGEVGRSGDRETEILMSGTSLHHPITPSPHHFINQSHSLTGVTRLPSGLLCRYRGSSSAEVRNWFTSVWQLLRISYLGISSCPPRVWQI